MDAIFSKWRQFLSVCLALLPAGTLQGKENLLSPDLSRAYTVRRWTLDDGLPVANASGFGTTKDWFNSVTFDAVTTTAVRLETRLQPTYSGVFSSCASRRETRHRQGT